MARNKILNVLSVMAISTMLTTIVTPIASAAERDIYDTKTGKIVYNFKDYSHNIKMQREIQLKMSLASEKYGYEHSGKVYNMIDVNKQFLASDRNVDKTLENLKVNEKPVFDVEKVDSVVESQESLELKAKEAVSAAEKMPMQSLCDSARELVNKLNEPSLKTSLLNRIEEVNKRIIAEAKAQAEAEAKAQAEAKAEAEAKEAVEVAEQMPIQALYDSAKESVNKLNDGSLKTSLLNRLEEVNECIIAQAKAEEESVAAVEEAEQMPIQSLYNLAKESVNKLNDGSFKTTLLNRLEEVNKRIIAQVEEEQAKAAKQAKAAVEAVEQMPIQSLYDSAKESVNKLNDGSLKTTLLNRLEEVNKNIPAVDPAEGAKKEVAKITADKVTFQVADADKANAKKVTKAAVEKAQTLVGKGYTVTSKADGTINSNKLTVTFVVTGTESTNKAETSALGVKFTVKSAVDPTEGAKKEVAKITADKVTFQVADADKANAKKVTKAAVEKAQTLVGKGYTVTPKADGTINSNKLTVTFVVTGTESTNKAETSELQVTFTV